MKAVCLYLLSALWLVACTSQTEPATEKAAPASAVAAETAAARASLLKKSLVLPGMPDSVAEAAAASPPPLSADERAYADTVSRLNQLIKPRFPKSAVTGLKSGDLNADRRPDMIVVAEEVDEEDVRHRTVFLVLNEGYPKLRIAAVNKTVVHSSNDGGMGIDDPLRNIVIKGNYFSFEHLLGGTDRVYSVVTFRYNRTRRDWLLHRIGEVEYSNGNDSTYETQRTRKDFGLVRFADYIGEL